MQFILNYYWNLNYEDKENKLRMDIKKKENE